MITGEAKIDKVVEYLRSKNVAIFQVNALTRNGRDELMSIFSRVFMEFQLNLEYLFNIYSAIVEVIFNGIKANVKYLLYQEELRQKLIHHANPDEIDELLEIILNEEALREFMNRFVVPDKIKKNTMRILKLEENLRTGRNLSEAEIKALQDFRAKLQKEEITIFFSIGIAPHQVVFSVVNDSPILKKDLARILKSRELHYQLYKEGRSTDYFAVENIDTTESAGLGIAMADEVYYEMKLDPRQYFTIVTEEGRTRALLRFPRERISML